VPQTCKKCTINKRFSISGVQANIYDILGIGYDDMNT